VQSAGEHLGPLHLSAKTLISTDEHSCSYRWGDCGLFEDCSHQDEEEE